MVGLKLIHVSKGGHWHHFGCIYIGALALIIAKWHLMASQTWINIGGGNGLLTDGNN